MNAKILIVDDSITSTHLYKTVLENESHTVFVSHDGKNIKDIIQQNNIDIVLLDIILPELNGFDILKSLQEDEDTREIPIIMITKLSSSKDVKKALDSGAFDYIRKSSESIEILARINSALRLKYKQDQLKELVNRDNLTNLYNRRFFNLTLDSIINQKEVYENGIGLIMIDCDYFKRVNDLYGHLIGDEVLMGLAKVLSKAADDTDIVCRFGGEEFSLILPNTTLFHACVKAEQIRELMQKQIFEFKEKSISLTVSCGVSHTKNGDNKTGTQLVGEADFALYKAKECGRNQVRMFKDEH